jgi:hypothetical protein
VASFSYSVVGKRPGRRRPGLALGQACVGGRDVPQPSVSAVSALIREHAAGLRSTFEAVTTDAWHVLSGSLQLLREEFDNAYARHHGRALPGSPAARELQQDDDLAGEWGARPVHDAHLASISPTMAAMDHLDSLGLLLTSPGGLMASHTVARSTLDIATKPWFLLEPDIGARERVRRYMNYRLQSLKEQSLITGDNRPRKQRPFADR